VRYYDLTLFNAAGVPYAVGANGFTTGAAGQPTFSSRLNGVNNPAALNVEWDIPIAPFATFQGLQSIRVWGIGLQMMAQAALLSPASPGALGAAFTLAAGMKPGLPLATAAAGQARVIAQGSVFQAFGNWQGVNQTLELVVQSVALNPTGGIKWSWQPGQGLGAAIQNSLLAAYSASGYSVPTPNVAVSIVQQQSTKNVSGAYPSLDAFASMILEQSKAIGAQQTGNAQYPGVAIVCFGKTIYVYDYSWTGAPVQLAFQDLIGQPTWINPATVNFRAVMRGDLQVGSQVKFPTGIVSPYALTTATAAVPGTPARNASAFQGTFVVTEVHHFANFRQADADSWVTAFNAVPYIGA